MGQDGAFRKAGPRKGGTTILYLKQIMSNLEAYRSALSKSLAHRRLSELELARARTLGVARRVMGVIGVLTVRSVCRRLRYLSLHRVQMEALPVLQVGSWVCWQEGNIWLPHVDISFIALALRAGCASGCSAPYVGRICLPCNIDQIAVSYQPLSLYNNCHNE